MSETGLFINDRDLFLLVLESGKSKDEEFASGKDFLAVLSYDEKKKDKTVCVCVFVKLALVLMSPFYK